MDAALLMPTVYAAKLPRQARAEKLNPIAEEEQFEDEVRREEDTIDRHILDAYASFVSPVTDDFPTPKAPGFAAGAAYVVSPSSSVNTASLTWTSSGSTRGTTDTAYDDLYDVSDAEEPRNVSSRAEEAGHDDVETEDGLIPLVIVRRLKSLAEQEKRARKRQQAPEMPKDRNSYLSLVIPDGPGGREAKNSPVPPTPPPKIPISPAVLSLLARDIPSSTAPPSLDGSLSSEQVANSTAPPTPNVEAAGGEQMTWDGGVQLNPEAMATLQILSEEDEGERTDQTIEVNQQDQRRVPLLPRQESDETIRPAGRQSMAEVSKLDIPSMRDFFGSLAGNARHTWAPPSSTTAEHFYNAPWNAPEMCTVEQIVEVDSTVNTDGPSTAGLETPRAHKPTEAVVDSAATTEAGIDYDEDYEKCLKEVGSVSLDRTSLWLNSQTTLLADLRGPVDPAVPGTSTELAKAAAAASPPNKKCVRFSGDVAEADGRAKASHKPDPIFWRGLQYQLYKTEPRDAVRFCQPRFDAVQTKRISAPLAHRDQLLGKFQPLVKPVTADPDEEVTEAHRQTARAAKERNALEQMNAAAWHVMGAQALNGGKLFHSPVARRLARQPLRLGSAGSRASNRRRVLDLGGKPVCDWAWHCAEHFPWSKVYTAVGKASRQPGQASVRGPPNHLQVAVPQLWKLPFPDKFFDVVSARSLHALLKTDRPSGEADDEYDLCLRECLRCLKPGGYLEFSVLDSDILRAGPLGSAMSVEFGFNLKTRGYDPTPTRGFLGRVRKAGFVSTKRSWMVLPMGGPGASDEPESGSRGSTAEVAGLTGLVGSLAWERWMLKLQMESGKAQDSLLEGVAGVIQEGSERGAAWRCLLGWARRPLTDA
ncbi:MAG: hypothetical protein M1832_001318 [Thelocarpon impressellum]|nr:MAG: hypothetical protein M1832_001318 [Thelocarpon impressellum]